MHVIRLNLLIQEIMHVRVHFPSIKLYRICMISNFLVILSKKELNTMCMIPYLVVLLIYISTDLLTVKSPEDAQRSCG